MSRLWDRPLWAAVPVAVTVLLLAIGAFVPSLAGGVAANQIPVSEAGDAALANPDASGWEEIQAVDVPLASAPSSVPEASDTSVEELSVKAAISESQFFLRLSWSDATADQSITDPQAFVDAAAVQLPVNATTRPQIAMGSTRSPVTVWYWNPESGAEELVAGGPGSTTLIEDGAVTATATHSNGRWQLVMSRDLSVGEGRTTIHPDRDLDVALAVWNGSNLERSGRKSVSEWHSFAMGPGPQGPPFEAILWAIAGLAIVAVIVVTALAVRRR
ncbi:MAG: ethylbenzene dehydrogenase-related protein [Halobacteriales archaeon]|nr:ethylbenzene dehydrogenase-related protein [Halobacteriales archaeon]